MNCGERGGPPTFFSFACSVRLHQKLVSDLPLKPAPILLPIIARSTCPSIATLLLNRPVPLQSIPGLPLHFKGGRGPLHCFIFQTSCVVRRGAAIHQTDAKRLFTSISAPPLFARDFCELGSRNLAFKVPQVFPGLILLPQEHISLNEATVAINARDNVHFLFR